MFFRSHLIFLCAGLSLLACASPATFQPKSQYPPDPWVKGYADENDCIGGESLAARNIPLPEYPKRALKNGLQGWVIVKLDVAADGLVKSIETERALPKGVFENTTLNKLATWRFAPLPEKLATESGIPELTNCRILIRYRLGKVMIAQ